MAIERVGLVLALGVWAGCSGDRTRVEPGDPVRSVVRVSFDAPVAGEAFVRWTVGGRERERVIGEGPAGPWETAVWIPGGERAEIVGGVRTPGGRVHEARPGRIRAPAPPRKLEVEVSWHDRGRSQLHGGVIALNAYDDWDSYAAVIDPDGGVLWWIEPDDPAERILRVRPGRDGHSLLWSRFAAAHKRDEDRGAIGRLDLDPDQRRTDTRAFRHHHDFVELPDRRLAWLSWVDDPSRWVPALGEVPVIADALRVADEGAGEGQHDVIFDQLEDVPGDVFYTCGHMNPGYFVPRPFWEWTHTNSLDWDDATASFRMIVRYWDALLEVGLDGELRWQAGGRRSDFAVDDWFSHAHGSDLFGDPLVVFDNQDHAPEPIVSRVSAYHLDPGARTATKLWSIPDPRGRYTTHLGDARLLPGGNVLVAFSPGGRLQEFTPEGDVVWEARFPGEITVGRVTWTDALGPR